MSQESSTTLVNAETVLASCSVAVLKKEGISLDVLEVYVYNMAQWSSQTSSFNGGHFGKPFWMSPTQDKENRHSQQTTPFRSNGPARHVTENSTRNLWWTIEKQKKDGALFEECTFCNRPQSHVLCCACGHMFMGRYEPDVSNIHLPYI